MTARNVIGVPVRVIAVQTLQRVIEQGRSLKAVLDEVLSTLQDPRDRALVEAIVFTVLRRYSAYQTTIHRWMPSPLRQRQLLLQWIIMVGFAQLDHLGLAAHAAVSTTVECCRALGWASHRALVNALLRRAQREGIPAQNPSDLWPRWLRQRIQSDWPSHADAVFAASAESAPMWLRVNAQRQSAQQYSQRLHASGIEATLCRLDQAVCLPRPVPIKRLLGFEQGDVSIQDFSAQLVAGLLAPSPHSRILDACAAPGGKTAHLLERYPSLQLTAIDCDKTRMQRMIASCLRLNLRVDCLVANMEDLSSWWNKQLFDGVLLDAPCSATGIVRRHPDLLFHRKPHDIEKLLNLQVQLLDACWRVLKPGGILVYTTCSLLHAENHLQIASLISRTTNAQIIDAGDSYGHLIHNCRQRFPGEDLGDGFFYAKLMKCH